MNMLISIFIITTGVRQGNPLSYTLLSININDFASLISEGKCVDIDYVDSIDFSCLLFAGDIVLVASSESELQHLLDIAFKQTKE